MAEANAGEDGKFLVYEGPKKSVKYPIKVLYCPGSYALINYEILQSHLKGHNSIR